MDDGRGACVQEVEAFQYLPAPAAHDLRPELLQPLHVAVQGVVGSLGEG